MSSGFVELCKVNNSPDAVRRFANFNLKGVPMTGDKLVADLQRIAATEVDYYDKDEIDVVEMMLDTLETAHPEATPEQLQLAVRRAEFTFTRRIADVEG